MRHARHRATLVGVHPHYRDAAKKPHPALSPDGTTVAYAMRVNDSWDIYAQRVGGRNATPIVNDPQRDEKGAAFSPDGSQIAFHISDPTGGIFIAGATGNPCGGSRVGLRPGVVPDGKQIAYGTEEIGEPSQRLGVSTLYVVNVSGGAPRKLVDGDGVAAVWSPSGRPHRLLEQRRRAARSLYRSLNGRDAGSRDERLGNRLVAGVVTRRDVCLLLERPRHGNEPLAIAVDESSGAVRGAPEP
jgi:dipeptidyl aminopeptidase/acylaminoacyl peptidase